MVTFTTHRFTGIAAALALGWPLTGAAQAVTPQEQLAVYSTAAGGKGEPAPWC
jgi:hypothetical protein